MIPKHLTKDFILEWGITIVLIVGVALTSFNIFPLNLWISVIGNIGWLYLGYIWRKWSLLVVQLIITAIYIVGLINLYY
jgi:hypothetical protein